VTYVEFGPEFAARACQGMVCGLFGFPLFPAPAAARVARTLLPSMHHRFQSTKLSSSKRICKTSTIRAQVPSLRQRLNPSYTGSARVRTARGHPANGDFPVPQPPEDPVEDLAMGPSITRPAYRSAA
jgi:hypothetical protein